MKYKITLLLLLTVMFLSCTKEESQQQAIKEPEKKIMPQQLEAFSFIPKDFSKYLFVKSTPDSYEVAMGSDFYKNFKKNYLLLDLKYNYSEDIDLFFTRFNMEFEDLLSYIEKDTVFGVGKSGFFLVASMTYKSKIFTSILNISNKTTIGEKSIKGYKIYNIKKGSGYICYTIINDYILFADNDKTISKMIDSAVNEENKELDYSNISDTSIIYKTQVDYRENPFDLFPLVKNMEVKFDLSTRELSFIADPSNPEYEYEDNGDLNYHETLKLIDFDTPLVYYNSSYSLKNILPSLLENPDTNFSKEIEELQGGVYFIVDEIKPLLSNDNPSLAMIVNLKKNEELSVDNEFISVTEEILGTTWEEEEISKGVKLYSSSISSFYMVGEAETRYALFTNINMVNSYLDKLNNPGSSLYDRYKNKLGTDNDLLESFMCINSKTLTETSRDLIQRYLYSSINMGDDEYNKSFKPFIDYFELMGEGYLNFKYDNEQKRFYGKLN